MNLHMLKYTEIIMSNSISNMNTKVDYFDWSVYP